MKIIVAAAFALLLSGCGGTPEITAIETTVTVTEPPVTITEQAEPAPAETVVVTETVEAPAPAQEDAVLQDQVMQMTWDDMSISEQADICMGWDMPELRSMLLDTFMSSSGEMFDRGIAEQFFNKVCP